MCNRPDTPDWDTEWPPWDEECGWSVDTEPVEEVDEYLITLYCLWYLYSIGYL